MFADEIRRAVETAARVELPEVAAVMWQAFGAGHLTEAEAEELTGLIEARKVVPGGIPQRTEKPFRGSRPRTDASMERRRRWAASGRLPPQLACKFTLAEQAVLAVVAMEVAKRGTCTLALDHIAALAGVSRATVRNAMKQARTIGCITVEERRATTWRNLPNVVRIVSPEWQAWMKLARKGDAVGGGRKSLAPTSTGRQKKLPRGRVRPPFRAS